MTTTGQGGPTGDEFGRHGTTGASIFAALSLSFADAGQVAAISSATLKRLVRANQLSWPKERHELGVPADRISGYEVVRAHAWDHFLASGAKPTNRTRAFLAEHRFDLRPFLLVQRADKIVVMIDRGHLLETVTDPGVYAVYDPSALLQRLGLTGD